MYNIHTVVCTRKGIINAYYAYVYIRAVSTTTVDYFLLRKTRPPTEEFATTSPSNDSNPDRGLTLDVLVLL